MLISAVCSTEFAQSTANDCLLSGDLLKPPAQFDRPAPAEVPVVPGLRHQQKHEQRGFNRARTLTRNALSILKKSHPRWKLAQAPSTPLWLRWTESHAGLAARQLRLNMRGSFAVSDPQPIRSKHILLVDDILTAGVGAREAARALLRPGAATARVAARARRLNERRDDERRDNANLQIQGDLHAGDTPATGRMRTDLSQGSSQGSNHRIVHRNTNHLFDEGIKDVAGKSYDSRP